MSTLRLTSMFIILALAIVAAGFISPPALWAAKAEAEAEAKPEGGTPQAPVVPAAPARPDTSSAVITAPEKFYLLPMSGMADEGRFYLYVNESVVMTSTFQWKDDGSYESRHIRAVSGQSGKLFFSISVDSQGVWTKMHLESPRGPTEVIREGNIVELKGSKVTRAVSLKPGTVIFGNLDPALISLAIRAYDQTKGGKQTIPVLVIPEGFEEASLERHETSERAIAGKNVKLTRYTYGLRTVSMGIYADEKGRIVYVVIPSQRAIYVREGYDALLKTAAPDLPISKPK